MRGRVFLWGGLITHWSPFLGGWGGAPDFFFLVIRLDCITFIFCFVFFWVSFGLNLNEIKIKINCVLVIQNGFLFFCWYFTFFYIYIIDIKMDFFSLNRCTLSIWNIETTGSPWLYVVAGDRGVTAKWWRVGVLLACEGARLLCFWWGEEKSRNLLAPPSAVGRAFPSMRSLFNAKSVCSGSTPPPPPSIST